MAYTSSQVVQAVPTGINSALVWITGGTATSAATQTFTNVFSSTYTNYHVILNQIAMTYSNTGINLRYGTSGTPDTSSNYWFGIQRIDTGSSVGGVGNGPLTSQSLGANYGNNDSGSKIEITICNPNLALGTFSSGTGWGAYGASGAAYIFNHHGLANTTSQYTDLVLFAGTGSITLKYNIYGYTNS